MTFYFQNSLGASREGKPKLVHGQAAVCGMRSEAESRPKIVTKSALSHTLSWQLPTLALQLPSAQEGLTAVFGMRTGEKRIFGASQGRTERRRRRHGEKFSQQRKTFGDPCDKPSKILFWRLATLAVRLPSPQLGLTAVFGMRTGVTRAMKHQNKIFDKTFNTLKASGKWARIFVRARTNGGARGWI